MTLVSPHPRTKVIEILRREVDRPPSFWRSVVTLNVQYFSGTARVCGTVHAAGFELRNRRGPAFSLRAIGALRETPEGTEILVEFLRPRVPDVSALLFGRHDVDRQTIVGFLRNRLQARDPT